jgi:non-specific serine/threonine protein kinase
MHSETRSYAIIVNLEYNELLTRYIPEPYIVKVDYGHTLGILRAKATRITTPSYNIIIDQNISDKLIKLTDQLTLGTIEEKFTTKKRNQNTLVKAMLVPEVKDLLLKYYDRMSSALFSFLRENRISIIIDIVRKTRLEDLKIVSAPKPIIPILRFEKTQTGIKYALKLNNQHSPPWSPKTRDVHILTNHNCWIIVDFVLYQLKEINGNKLKPFLKNDHIFIKNEMVITYFEKFIIEVAKKSEIEAVGFEVNQTDKITDCTISASYDFISEEIVLDLIYKYNGAEFSLGNPAQNKTKLNISDDKQITISQVKRNANQEQRWLQKLLKKGLKLNNIKKIKLDEEDELGLFQFLINNKESIIDSGFRIDTPLIDGKAISLERQSISLNSSPNADWFDIHGVVTIGSDRIPFAHLLEYIKNGDRYYPLENGTYFVIPKSWMTKYEELAKFGIKNGDNIKIRKSQYSFLEEIDELSSSIKQSISEQKEVEYVPSTHLKATLRPYQEAGVKWLINLQANGLGACLADDMGLGKTLQTIALLSYTKDKNREKKPKAKKSNSGQLTMFATAMKDEINPLQALIILPSSLVFNWKAEIKKFNQSLHVLEFIGTKRRKSFDSLDKFDVVLTTYHTVLRDIEKLKTIKWEYVILDESQMIKNKESKMFKAINEIPAENRLSLSGTPIENSLSDLWSQMQFINPEMLGSFPFFKAHYLIPIEKHQDINALAQLANLIKPYILRRTKEEVAPDLPPLTEQIEYIGLEKAQLDIYNKVKSATRNYLLGLDDTDRTYKFHVFAALTKLRQIANDPYMVDTEYEGGSEKKKYILSKMDEVRKSGHKVLIFSAFTKLISIFQKECEANEWEFVSLTGKDNQKQRKTSVDKFQTDNDVSFFFISLKAGGTGLNLTAADYVFILDPWWNPFAEKQAIARAHRIGQEKPVTVIRYIAKETIEEKILKLQERKTNLSNDIIHFDEEKLNLEKTDFQYLLD